MITLGLWNGAWHIITLMDGALLCRLDEEDWDDNSMIEEYTEVAMLHEGVCVKCARKAINYDKEMRGF